MKPEYSWSMDFLRWIRAGEDGITFFELSCVLDLFKADHNPRFAIMLVIVNLKIFEFEIYNINHVEDEDDY